jgi:hypothetical protein
MPEAEREKLLRLQQRHDVLLAMLPTDVHELADLDAASLDAKLAEIELIAAEMTSISAAECAILEELERH